MSVTVAPGASFEAVAAGFATGLTGTIGVRIIDNAGNTTTARATASISEYPAGSGIYAKTMTAPATAGQYTVLWDNGATTPGNVAVEDLVVTSNAAAAFGSANLYVTDTELKATLNIGSSYADADILKACAGASRVCDSYTNDWFYPVTMTRYYTGDPCERRVSIDSLNTLTSVAVDTTGDGTYGTAWTLGTHFFLDPINAVTDGHPYKALAIRRQNGSRFPAYDNNIKIVGSFGWAETPANVAQAATILAGRLLKRSRETPYGIVTVVGDAVAAARIGKVDPDVALLLDNLPGAVPLLAV